MQAYIEEAYMMSGCEAYMMLACEPVAAAEKVSVLHDARAGARVRERTEHSAKQAEA